METSHRIGGFGRPVLNNIRFNARSLARCRAVPGMEVDDFEQDLALDLVRRMRAFDPTLASFATFADRVVGHRVASLRTSNDRRQGERAWISLDAAVTDAADGDRRTLIEVLPAEAPAVDEAAIASIDVGRFLRQLPPGLIDCCAVLLAPNIAAGCRDLSLDRSTAYKRIGLLRSSAIASGLAVYFAGPTDTSPPRPVCGRNGNERESFPMSNRLRPARTSLLIAEADLRAWLATARAGDVLEYHHGVLAIDRLAHGSRLGGRDRAELDRVANVLWQLAQSGRGHLLQHRHGDGDYSYVFVLRTVFADGHELPVVGREARS